MFRAFKSTLEEIVGRLSWLTLSTPSNENELPPDFNTSGDAPSPTTQIDEKSDVKYYAVALLAGPVSDPESKGFVLTDKKELMRVLAIHRNSRFKEFNDENSAREFAASPIHIPEVKTSDEESFSRSVTCQELCQLRLMIERGEELAVSKAIWASPKLLRGKSEALPSVLHEGMKYNALHVAAKCNQPFILQLVLDFLENPIFLRLLYPDESQSSLQKRMRQMLDLYLNTPDKRTGDTPLHYASKFGCLDCVKVLLSHPLCIPDKTNKSGLTPRDIICSRTDPVENNIKQKMNEAFDGLLYVAITRSCDDDGLSVITKPCPRKDLSPLFAYSKDSTVFITAFAGPMPPETAERLYLQLKNPFCSTITPKRRKRILDIRRTDSERGIETIGRMLAKEMSVEWNEYIPNLRSYLNLTSLDNLTVLETFFKKLMDELDDTDLILHEDSVSITHKYPSHVCSLAHDLNVCLMRFSDNGMSPSLSGWFYEPNCKSFKTDLFLSGSKLSSLDIHMLHAIKGLNPDFEKYLNVFKWVSKIESDLHCLGDGNILKLLSILDDE